MANGTPAWWETSAGCSCVTSWRQNTPDLLRKHTFDCLWYYELCHPSILIQSVFFIYPVLSVISCCNSWNMHIYSLSILKWDYLKARKLEAIEQNYLFEFSTPKLTKNTYPHSCLRPKIYFCKPVLLFQVFWNQQTPQQHLTNSNKAYESNIRLTWSLQPHLYRQCSRISLARIQKIFSKLGFWTWHQ